MTLCKTITWALGIGILVSTTTLSFAQSRYTPSANGDEVTDTQTGLVWKRCVEGMAWSGSTCTGSYATFTHEQALVQAKNSTNYRLPNVKELASIVDRTRSNPAIDPAAFPATPSQWHWTSTPYVGDSSYAWFVFFSYGNVYRYGLRYDYYAVRLVR
jgi:hypothetical protein